MSLQTNVATESAISQKKLLNGTAFVCLCLQGIIVLGILLFGLFATFIGSLFFDDPNASYFQFLLTFLGIPILIGVTFVASLILYVKKYYGISLLISSIFILSIIGLMVFSNINAQLRHTALHNLLYTPTLTNFPCSNGDVITIDSNNKFSQITSLGAPNSYITLPFGSVDPTLGTFTYYKLSQGEVIPTTTINELGTCRNVNGKTFFDLYKEASSTSVGEGAVQDAMTQASA